MSARERWSGGLITLSILGTCALTSVACDSGPAISTGTTASAIIGGVADAGDPAVMYLAAYNGNAYAACTAELIAPTVLVTAAHCLVDPAFQGAQYTVYTDPAAGFPPSASARSTALTVKSTHPDPLFDGNTGATGHDIGVVILAQSVNVPPLRFARSPLSPALAGRPTRIIGYGTNDNGGTQGAGTKRQVTTKVDDISNLWLHIGTSTAQTCEGDSGGAALMMIDGVETLVGLTAYGTGTQAEPCLDGAYSTRIDLYGSFLATYLPVCTPQCSGKTCGPDGCGGTCGACAGDETCSDAGVCLAPPPSAKGTGETGNGGAPPSGSGAPDPGSAAPPADASGGSNAQSSGSAAGVQNSAQAGPQNSNEPIAGSGFRGGDIGGSGCTCVRRAVGSRDAPGLPSMALAVALGLVTALRRTTGVPRRSRTRRSAGTRRGAAPFGR